MLSITTNADDKTLLFEIVFVIVWLGGAIIAINGQLLGGTISFFQSICLLGYCLFPLNLAAMLNVFLNPFVHVAVKIAYVAVAFVWSTYCKFFFFLEIQPRFILLRKWYLMIEKNQLCIPFACFTYSCLGSSYCDLKIYKIS